MEKRVQALADPFAMFVKAVEGHMVRRYGTKTNIGVLADGKGSIVWDTETIHVFTTDEVRTYGTEYRRAVADGALVEVKREAWDAQRKSRKADAKKAAEAVVAEAVEHANKEAVAPVVAEKVG